MKYFDFEICGLKRKLPYVEVAENLALASFVCLSHTELVQTVAPELVKRLPPVDYFPKPDRLRTQHLTWSYT